MFSVLVVLQTPGFSAVRRKSSAPRPHPYLSSPARRPATKAAPSTPAVAGSVSGQMDARELRDEVLHMKKEMNGMRKERDLAKAQQVRLSQDVRKKDKQIEDLMSTGLVSTHDATRSLVKTSNKADRSGGGGALASSLRQQVHSLERALREKEGQVTELRNGVSAARLKEMEVQAETYYRETHRLTHLLEDGGGVNGGGDVLVSPQSAREARIKLKALNQAMVKMAAQMESLEEENRAFKRKIRESGAAPSPPAAGARGSISDGYQDSGRAQLLAAIVELETRCMELEKKVDSARESKDRARVLYEQRIRELRSELAAASSKASNFEQELVAWSGKESKFKAVIHRLKDDRTHYRSASEHTQKELLAVQEHLGREEISREQVAEELQVVREEYHNEMRAIQHSRKLARKPSNVFTPHREKTEAAASLIQLTWRKRQAVVKQERYQKETKGAIVSIQSALKAHLIRKRTAFLQNGSSAADSASDPAGGGRDLDSESCGSSEAVEAIQSAVRGYFTRQMVLQDLGQSSASLAIKDGLDEVHKKENITSSLLRYTPPPHQIKATRNNKLLDSSWREQGSEDEDYQYVHSRPYLNVSSSTESELQDPDKCLLLDEL